jgi:iron complex transport system ATP-binding protein
VSLLTLEELSAAPWGPPLLSGVSLELAAGTVLGIIGPNGAGKSSLLHTVAGDLPASGGTLEFAGRALADWSPRERARRLAVLPQRSRLNFPFRVEEVVMLGRTPHDTGRERDGQIVDEILAALDIEQLRRRPYTALSGGEQQRVQLGRVLAQVWPAAGREPVLLLLDEPTSALDLAHQQQLMALLRELAGRGCAVMMVLHDFNLLASLADELVALREGHCRARGTPAEVLTADMFREVFDVDVHIGEHPRTGAPVVSSP